MENHVQIVFEGEFGGFFPPAKNVERFSYAFINPSAARGCLEAILYKKEFLYEISEIHILSDIIHTSVKVNEVEGTPSLKNPIINVTSHRTQRSQYLLQNPAYLIKANISLTQEGLEGVDSHGGKNTVAKYVSMFNRRLERGEHFNMPCFGQRQFFANFREVLKEDKAKPINRIERNMVYDCFDLSKPRTKDYSNRKITYFDAIAKDGIVSVPSWKQIQLENS